MDFNEYQRRAQETDQQPGEVIVPLLGLAGEAGTLLSEYKKHLRDGSAHQLHKERVVEELGDLLWYIANVASKYGLDLDEIADGNLTKTYNRWTLRGRGGAGPEGTHHFDRAFPEGERFPRRFVVEIRQVDTNKGIRVQMMMDGKQIGDTLSDNAYDPDDYRFHDAFHLTHAAVLGWSPVIRMLLERKRRSNETTDEVEDGGRARVIEEGIAAFVFEYAREHAFLDGVTTIDENLVRIIKRVTSHLEVAACSVGEWETAILRGYDVWRKLRAHGGGHLALDLDARTIIFHPPGQ